MKPTAFLRSFLLIAGSALLGISYVHAANYYWDGNDGTAGFGTATGTWAAPTTGTTTSGWSNDVTGATVVNANSITTGTADTINFGNGATGLAAGTITVSGTVDSGDMTFASGSGAIILSGGIINLAAAQTTTVNNATSTINSSLTGAGTSFTKDGSGILALSGASSYTGTTIIKRGTLTLNSQTGSLATTTPLTFSGTGTFNMDNTGAGGALTQTLGALTFGAGQGTVQITRTAAFDQAITFASLAARTAGATGNFVNAGGTNSATNGFIFTSAPTAGTLIDRGIFYNGSSYATYDAGGFIRGFTAGDTNYLAAPAAATIGASTATSNVDLTTGNITGQTTVSANTINMRNYNIAMSGSNQVLSVNGLLSSGSGSATLGGGTTPRLQATAAGGEIVVRVNGASDVLTVTSAIRNFGVDSGGTASALTKTGAGTLAINTAGTFTGALSVNSGVLNYASAPTYSSANVAAGATWNYANAFGNNPTFNVPFTINGSFIKTANGSMTFNSGATISGSGSLSFSGQVTIAINSDNPNFTGTINEISQGGSGFNIGHNGALGNGLLIFGANTNDIRSTVGGAGYVAAYNSTYRFDASRTFGGNGVNMNFGSGAVTLNAAGVVATVSNTTTFNGAIGESGGARTFGKAGTGTLVLGGSTSNTYTGLTSVTAGTLQLNKSGTANAIAGGGLSVGTGTTVTYTGASTDMIGNAAPVSVTGTGLLNLNGVSDTIGTLGLTAVAGNNALVTTGAGTLTLGGNVTFTAATTGRAQISGNLALGAATRTFTVGLGSGAGQDLLIDAAISGTGVGLTKAGTGRLTLSGTNSYDGLTTVSAGTLIVLNGGALGGGGGLSVGAGIFTYAPTAAGALNLGSNALTLANGSAIGAALGGTAGQSAITSSATASLTGTGVVNVRPISGVSITAGTNNLITAASGLTGGTYTLGTVYNNTDFTVSNFTRSATAISVDVASATALSGNVHWKGGLSGNTGVWSASNGSTQSNWQVTDGVNQGIAPGATTDLVFSTTTSPGTMAGMTLGANMTVRTITVNNTATAFSLNADGNTLTITPSSSSTGITIGSGVQASTISAPVVLGAAQTWTNNSVNALSMASIVNQNGNSLIFDGSGNFNFDNNAAGISGAGGIIKNGTGQLIFTTSAAPTYTFTGDITLNGGYIGFQNSSVLSGRNTKITGGYLGGRFNSGFTWTGGLGTGANQIQITGGTSGFSGEGSTGSAFQIGTALSTLVWGALGEGTATGFFNPTVLLANGPARSNTNGKGSLNNGINLNGATRTITSTQTTDNAASSGFTISGVISNSTGTSGLTKTGVGNLILAAANTFNGLTTVSGGFLTLGNASALQNSVLDTTNSIAGSGTAGLRTTVTTLTLGGLIGNKNFAATGGVFTTATGGYGAVTSLTLNPAAADNLSYSGAIGNGAATTSLTKNGLGTQILSGTNTYTGNTLVSAGTLQFAKQVSLYNNGAAAAWSKTNINVNSGATMALNIGGSGEFTKANVITLLGLADATTNGFKTGAILGLDTTSADFLYDSVIANPNGGTNVLGLTKLGSNKLTLDQTNTYTGATTVSAGTLIVDGNISTSVLTTVNSGATLGGIGTVGDLTIDAGGFFSPGNSPGIETVDGDYIQNGTLQVEIEGLTAGNGTGFHDQVVVNGTVTLNGLLSIISFSGIYAANDLIFILLNDGVDSISGTFTGLAQGASVGSFAGKSWNISYTGKSEGSPAFTGGNDVVLMAIPEPRAALLGGLGMLLLLRRRRN